MAMSRDNARPRFGSARRARRYFASTLVASQTTISQTEMLVGE